MQQSYDIHFEINGITYMLKTTNEIDNETEALISYEDVVYKNYNKIDVIDLDNEEYDHLCAIWDAFNHSKLAQLLTDQHSSFTYNIDTQKFQKDY